MWGSINFLEADNYLQQQYKGAQIRTKLYNNVNETPTKQFLTIEQNVQENRQIKEIKSLYGQMYTEPTDICNSFKDFYETLYRSEPTCPHTQNTLLEYVKPLEEGSKAELDTPITLVDLKNALQAMQPNKTPGSDGLTVEFYKYFFDRLSPLF